MLGNSRTGQLTGFLMNNWVPDSVPRFIISDGGGVQNTLEWNAFSLLNGSRRLLRIVLNAGPAAGELKRLCRDFSNNTVKRAVIPQWFFLDMLVSLEQGAQPVNITFIQTAVKEAAGAAAEECEHRITQNFFIDGKLKASASSGAAVSAVVWEKVHNVYSRLGAGEFWSRLTGATRPSWGVLSERRSGTLCLPEENFHFCYIKKGARLPDFIDEFDLSRVEGLLHDSGLEIREFMNESKRSKDYIVKFIKMLQSPAAQESAVSGVE